MCRIGSPAGFGYWPDFNNRFDYCCRNASCGDNRASRGFVAGQKIFHLIPAGNGMSILDKFPATIGNITSTGYDITNLSTVGQTAYTANSGTCYIYTSLNLGSRGEFPIVFPSGDPLVPVRTSPAFWLLNDLKVFYFDKNIIGKSDGAGNHVKVVWMMILPGPERKRPLGWRAARDHDPVDCRTKTDGTEKSDQNVGVLSASRYVVD